MGVEIQRHDLSHLSQYFREDGSLTNYTMRWELNDEKLYGNILDSQRLSRNPNKGLSGCLLHTPHQAPLDEWTGPLNPIQRRRSFPSLRPWIAHWRCLPRSPEVDLLAMLPFPGAHAEMSRRRPHDPVNHLCICFLLAWPPGNDSWLAHLLFPEANWEWWLLRARLLYRQPRE